MCVSIGFVRSEDISALKRDVKELRPLAQKLQSSYSNLQSEVSSLKKEMEELKQQMKGILMAGANMDDHKLEETISLEELDHQQVSFSST